MEEDEQLKNERIKSYIIYLFGPRLIRDVYNSKWQVAMMMRSLYLKLATSEALLWIPLCTNSLHKPPKGKGINR